MWPLAWCHSQLSTFSTSEVLFASNMIFITATITWKCATSCKYQKPYWITNCSLLSELGFDHCSLFWVPYAQGHHIFNLLLSSLEWKYLSFFLLMCHFQNLCHRTSTFVLVHALCHARVTGVTHYSGVVNNNLTLSLFCVFHNTLMYRMETISIMNKNWVSNYWLPHLSRWPPPQTVVLVVTCLLTVYSFLPLYEWLFYPSEHYIKPALTRGQYMSIPQVYLVN